MPRSRTGPTRGANCRSRGPYITGGRTTAAQTRPRAWASRTSRSASCLERPYASAAGSSGSGTDSSVGRLEVAVTAEDRRAAHVDEARPGGGRRGHEVLRARHVHPPEGLVVAPGPDRGRGVEDGAAPGRGDAQGSGVGEIARHRLRAEGLEPRRPRAVPHEGPHLPARAAQALDDAGAEHPRAAGHQGAHHEPPFCARPVRGRAKATTESPRLEWRPPCPPAAITTYWRPPTRAR